ncbi:MAG TPA: ATP-binding protein [Usitatibacter sp.]|nr:ATP-binding protein [Usitatibacter sp.]
MDHVGQEPERALPAVPTRRRAGLFSKYFAFIVLLVSAGLVASGAIGLYFSYQETRNSLVSLQREKALTAAVRIEHFLRDIESQLGWTTLPLLVPAQSAMEGRRLDFLKVLRQLPAVTEISHLDGQGREQLKVSRLAMDTAGSGLDFSTDPRFVEARKGKAWFGPVYFRKETEPYMAISIAEARDRPGATVVEVNLKFIWDVVSRIRIGQKGIAYVVDDKGFLVAHPDISLVLRKVNLSNLPQVREALAAKADSEWREPAAARDVNNEEVLSAYARVAPTGWLVFVEEPVSAVFAPLYDAMLRTVFLLFAGVLISVFASVFLARRMVQPVRALQLGADRIGAGDLDSQIEVRTGDELEDLAGRFNTMTAQLRESYAGLEQKVQDRTAELRESLDQQTAVSEILRVISSSPTDVQPVLDAVAENASRICGADNGAVVLLRGDMLVPMANNFNAELLAPFPLDRGSVIGRAISEGRTISVADLETEGDDFPRAKAQAEVDHSRSLIGTPLMLEGAAIGGIALWRREAAPFSARQLELAETFARQAVIAIQNVRLFNELQARNRDLGESLEQQTATADILRVISRSTTDVEPVFQAIVDSAKRLGQAFNAYAFSYDGELIRYVTSTDTRPEWLETMREMAAGWRADNSTVSGRVMLSRATCQIEDMRHDEAYRAHAGPVGEERSVLGVPMLRDGRPIGSLHVCWLEPGAVPAKFVRLLETFAAQAVIAIENVRLFNEIQDKSRQLEIANKHKSDFLANMSHELRTPLNAIIGFSDVMLSGMTGPLPEKQGEFVGDIRDSGRHLLALINDILDLSKIEAGKMELDVATFDLKEATANAMTLVRGRADRHGINLESEIAPEVGGYDGDERKFKQIVLNLLTNAVKFTPEGGTVTMGAQRVNGAYVFSVRDTGVGIAPEDQKLIFEEFRQVGTDYERKAEGTGLGLALTRRLVHLHGGQLSVESAPGKGSTFTFTLPISQ